MALKAKLSAPLKLEIWVRVPVGTSSSFLSSKSLFPGEERAVMFGTIPKIFQDQTEVTFSPFEHREAVEWLLMHKLSRIRTPLILEALQRTPFEMHIPYRKRPAGRGKPREPYWYQYFGGSRPPAWLRCTGCHRRVRATKRTLFFVPSPRGLWPACAMCAKFLRYRGLCNPCDVIREHSRREPLVFHARYRLKRWTCPAFDVVFGLWRNAISRMQHRKHARFRCFRLSPHAATSFVAC